MRRALRIAILGPIYLVVAAAFLLVYPLLAFLRWLTTPDDVSTIALYRELGEQAWNELRGTP